MRTASHNDAHNPLADHYAPNPTTGYARPLGSIDTGAPDATHRLEWRRSYTPRTGAIGNRGSVHQRGSNPGSLMLGTIEQTGDGFHTVYYALVSNREAFSSVPNFVKTDLGTFASVEIALTAIAHVRAIQEARPRP